MLQGRIWNILHLEDKSDPQSGADDGDVFGEKS